MSSIRLLTIAFAASLALAAGCDDKQAPPQATVTPAATTQNSPTPAPGVATVTYVIDPATSKVEWTGSKVTAHHDGSFSQFKGFVTVPGGKPDAAKIHLDIDTPSLTTQPDKLQGHLKTPDFFDVEKFPKASFDSASIVAGGPNGATHTITGNLTLHGVTKAVTFPAIVTVTATKLSAKADFSLSRKDWNIVFPGMPNDLISDTVAIHLTIEAPAQSS